MTERRRYRFTVTAINRLGLRSLDTSLDVITSFGSPDAPAGLRASVYSPTAAGIAWDAPAPPITFQDVIPYEVCRDGKLVASRFGLSYIDDLLTGGTTHVYSIVAINGRAEHSRSSRISVTTPVGSSPTYPEAPDHVQERLANVFNIMTGDAIRAAVRQGKEVYRQLGSEQYPQMATTVTPGTSLGRTDYRCLEGGVAATRLYEAEGASDNPQKQFLLEDCASDFAFTNAVYEGGTLEEGPPRREASYCLRGRTSVTCLVQTPTTMERTASP